MSWITEIHRSSSTHGTSKYLNLGFNLFVSREISVALTNWPEKTLECNILLFVNHSSELNMLTKTLKHSVELQDRSLLLKNVFGMLDYSIALHRANYPETFLGLQQRLLKCLVADVSLTLHLEKIKLLPILMCPAPIDLTESKHSSLETREYESVCVTYMKVCLNKTTHWTTTLLWWKANAHQKGDKK